MLRPAGMIYPRHSQPPDWFGIPVWSFRWM